MAERGASLAPAAAPPHPPPEVITPRVPPVSPVCLRRVNYCGHQASQTLGTEAAHPSCDLAEALRLQLQPCPATGGESGKAKDAGAPGREAHPCAPTSTGWRSLGVLPVGLVPLTPPQPGSPLGTDDSDSTPPAVPRPGDSPRSPSAPGAADAARCARSHGSTSFRRSKSATRRRAIARTRPRGGSGDPRRGHSWPWVTTSPYPRDRPLLPLPRLPGCRLQSAAFGSGASRPEKPRAPLPPGQRPAQRRSEAPGPGPPGPLALGAHPPGGGQRSGDLGGL